MIYLTDKRTNYYYLGKNDEVKIYYKVKDIPIEYKKKPYIKAEYFEEIEELYTRLYNNGIKRVSINERTERIEIEEIENYNPNKLRYYIAKYLTTKNKEYYKKLWEEKIYVLIKNNEEGRLIYLTVTNKEKEKYIIGFSSIREAYKFKEKSEKEEYIIIGFKPEKGKKYIISEENRKIILKEEGEEKK